MKKSLLTLLIGIFIGGAATLAMPTYAAVKQYMLTQVDYPIVVKGIEYKDPEHPILNYEGSTYVPLAKLGDLTGVVYKWNESLRQVEIGNTTPAPIEVPANDSQATDTGKKTDCNVAGQTGATLCPDTVIEWPEEPGYKGYADSKDPSYQMAIAEARDKQDYPPLLSEGWISVQMLDMIESVYFGGTGSGVYGEVEFGNKNFTNNHITYKKMVLPKEIVENRNGDYIVDGIHIQIFKRNVFFKISDLQYAGIISK